ncbi:TPA: DUF1642 domain-containing protein [Streptococcus pyogenes ABC020049299]|nr:DUF1642 domain-containing protein [Streptococcus pyogenes ABC020049299]HER0183547.1 DUF1642 domain-containing protein [Streptococcus pyogenes]
MNNEEAKRAIRELEAFNYFDFKGNLIKRIDVLGIIDQLGQPKVVVPKPVFEMIKFRKEHDQDLTTTFVNIHAYPDNVFHWVANNGDLFAQAWLAYPNITIEKEKLYTVEIPNPNREGRGHAKFVLERQGNKVFLVKRKSKDCYYNKNSNHLTESEIRKDFDWAWREGFAEEVTE